MCRHHEGKRRRTGDKQRGNIDRRNVKEKRRERESCTDRQINSSKNDKRPRRRLRENRGGEREKEPAMGGAEKRGGVYAALLI